MEIASDRFFIKHGQGHRNQKREGEEEGADLIIQLDDFRIGQAGRPCRQKADYEYADGIGDPIGKEHRVFQAEKLEPCHQGTSRARGPQLIHKSYL